MDVVQSTDNTIDVFMSDIDMYIKLWCEDNGIDNPMDICSISQNRFSALLYYLYLHVFKDADLKDHNKYDNGLFITNFNAYNLDLLCDIADIYMYLCDTYDKIISVDGYCKLVGVHKDTVYEWARDDKNKASSRSSYLAKKLTAERERTLADRLASGVKNPVGVLGCLNHWHNWAGVGNMEERKPQQISLSDVRRQASELSDNSSGVVAQIVEKGRSELSDNSNNSGTQ